MVSKRNVDYHFSLNSYKTRPGIEPQSTGPLANTVLIKPMAQYFNFGKYLHLFI